MNSNLPRILIVEDNPADVALLHHALAEQGEPVEIIVLTDGEQAVRFVEQQRTGESSAPCVILLDLHLPRIDGAGVLKSIAKSPKLDHVHVAVWTTLASPAEQEEALRLGADFYHLKPTSLEGYWTIAKLLIDMCHGRPVGTATSA